MICHNKTIPHGCLILENGPVTTVVVLKKESATTRCRVIINGAKGDISCTTKVVDASPIVLSKIAGKCGVDDGYHASTSAIDAATIAGAIVEIASAVVSKIARESRIDDGHYACYVVDGTAIATVGRIARKGRVSDGYRTCYVVDASSISASPIALISRIVRESRVSDGHRATGIVDGTAIAAADGTTNDTVS